MICDGNAQKLQEKNANLQNVEIELDRIPNPTCQTHRHHLQPPRMIWKLRRSYPENAHFRPLI